MSADVPNLVSVLSQLLWSVRRVCCGPLSHPLISEDKEEVGGSVGFTKESRGECLTVGRLVARTENRDYCYQLILAESDSGRWIKEPKSRWCLSDRTLSAQLGAYIYIFFFLPFLKNVANASANVGQCQWDKRLVVMCVRDGPNSPSFLKLGQWNIKRCSGQPASNDLTLFSSSYK